MEAWNRSLQQQISSNHEQIEHLQHAVAAARIVRTTLRAMYKQLLNLEERVKQIEAALVPLTKPPE